MLTFITATGFLLAIVSLTLGLPFILTWSDWVQEGKAVWFPWQHRRFCVCEPCNMKLIKKERKEYEERFARKIYQTRLDEIRSHLDSEFRKYQ